jgi:hypothetical protein
VQSQLPPCTMHHAPPCSGQVVNSESISFSHGAETTYFLPSLDTLALRKRTQSFVQTGRWKKSGWLPRPFRPSGMPPGENALLDASRPFLQHRESCLQSVLGQRQEEAHHKRCDLISVDPLTDLGASCFMPSTLVPRQLLTLPEYCTYLSGQAEMTFKVCVPCMLPQASKPFLFITFLPRPTLSGILILALAPPCPPLSGWWCCQGPCFNAVLDRGPKSLNELRRGCVDHQAIAVAS